MSNIKTEWTDRDLLDILAIMYFEQTNLGNAANIILKRVKRKEEWDSLCKKVKGLSYRINDKENLYNKEYGLIGPKDIFPKSWIDVFNKVCKK